MRVLVTGGAGYIGSHFVLGLIEAGHEAVVYDNLSTGHAWAVQGAELVVGEVSDQAKLEALITAGRFDALAHFAASIVVPESVAEPLKYYRNNSANTLGLLEVCARTGLERLVFSSTAAVYGAAERSPVHEDDPITPINPYGASKAMSERMIQDQAAASGLRYAILRYFNVAGGDLRGRAGQATANATHLIKVACETVVGKRQGMQVFGTDYPTPDGTCIRDYIHVDDLATAHLDALDHLQAGGDSTIVNCGYGHGSSVLEVLDAVKRVSGVDLPVTMADRRPGDSPDLVADNRKIRDVLGWAPRHDDLELIVRSALDWERQMAERPDLA